MTAVPLNIFISYSVADKVFVERLATDLQAHGMNAWVGHINLRSGQNWPNAIEAAIDSAQAVLVIWTPDAKKSKYVQKEYSYAIEQNKRVVPLIVKPCKLALLLNDLHWLDFTKPALRASQTNVLIDALENNESLPQPSTPPTSPVQHAPAYLLSGVLFLLMVTGLGFILHGTKHQSTMVTPTATASTTISPLGTITPGGAIATTGTAGAAGSSGGGGATKNGPTSTHTPTPTGYSPTLSPTSPPIVATPTITPTATNTRIPQ